MNMKTNRGGSKHNLAIFNIYKYDDYNFYTDIWLIVILSIRIIPAANFEINSRD